MVRRFGLVLVTAVLATAGVARAQTPPATGGATAATAQAPQTPPPAPAPAPGRGQRAGQAGALTPAATIRTVQEMMDGMELQQSQQKLEMSDSQLAAFFPKLHALQILRRQHLNNRGPLVNALRQSTKAGANVDEATLGAQVKALDDLEAQEVVKERAALDDIDSVLTVYQRARFRIFEEDLERLKVQFLAKVLASPGR